MAETVEIIIAAKDTASGVLKGVGTGLSSIGSIALNVAKVGFVGLTTGIAAVVGGLTTLVVKSAATADELAELSAKTGISVERLQELKFIGEQTGTSVETVTSSLARLVRSMASAEEGTGAASDAFAELGVSVTDTDGNLRDSEEVFADLIDALGEVENETQRDALAMAIFGKSAQELNPLILEGSDGLAAMAEEARNMGVVMSEESVMGLAAFNDTLEGGKLAIQGLLGTMAGEFVPIFQGAIDFLTGSVLPVLQAMAATFAENMAPALQEIGDLLTGIFSGDLEDPIGTIANIVWYLAQALGFSSEQSEVLFFAVNNLRDKFEEFLLILQPVFEAFKNLADTIIESFPQMKAQGAAFMEWLAGAFGTTFPTLAANVTGIVNALSALWKQHGDTIMAVIDGAFRTITVVIGGALTLITGLLNANLTAWSGDWSAGWDIMRQTLETFLNLALSLVGTNLAEFTASWTGTLELINIAVTTFTGQIISTLATFFLDMLASWEGNWNLFETIVDTVIGNITGFFDGLKATISSVISAVQNLINKILSIPGVPGAGNKGASTQGGGNTGASLTAGGGAFLTAESGATPDEQALMDAFGVPLEVARFYLSQRRASTVGFGDLGPGREAAPVGDFGGRRSGTGGETFGGAQQATGNIIYQLVLNVSEMPTNLLQEFNALQQMALVGG